MKNIIKLFTFPLLTIIGFNSCASIPLKIGESENNSTYTVSYLFEHDGCKVYRFYDKGNYVYFTTKGDVTSITNEFLKLQLQRLCGDFLFRACKTEFFLAVEILTADFFKQSQPILRKQKDDNSIQTGAVRLCKQ